MSIGEKRRQSLAKKRQNEKLDGVMIIKQRAGAVVAVPDSAGKGGNSREGALGRLGRAVSDALDPTKQPGKVRTMKDFTQAELDEIMRRGR